MEATPSTWLSPFRRLRQNAAHRARLAEIIVREVNERG
jgi:hypothetical protein